MLKGRRTKKTGTRDAKEEGEDRTVEGWKKEKRSGTSEERNQKFVK